MLAQQRPQEMPEPTDPTGWLLVGHGTRDPEGQREFQELVQQVAAVAAPTVVEGAFLEFAVPTIAGGLDALWFRGARRMRVVPVLLFSAGHAKTDIPAAVAHWNREHAAARCEVCPTLDCHPELIELSSQRGRESLPASWDADDTVLLLVGRGSRDVAANAEMARFARLRWEQFPCAWCEVCYLSMTGPKLEDALRVASGMPFANVLVQPHLLFAGELENRVIEAVGRARQEFPHRRWIAAGRLGVHEHVVRAVLDIAGGTPRDYRT